MTSDPWQPPTAPGPWHVTVTHRPPPGPPPIRWAAEARDFVGTGVVLFLLAPVVGLIWAAVAPKLSLLAVAEGSEEAFRVEIGADFRFLLLGVVAGVLCALVVGWLHKDGPGIVLGLAAGGLGAAFVAARVGYLADRGDTLGTLHQLGVSLRQLQHAGLDPFFRLRALGVVAAWPLAAVAVHMLVVTLRQRRREHLG